MNTASAVVLVVVVLERGKVRDVGGIRKVNGRNGNWVGDLVQVESRVKTFDLVPTER